MRFHACLSDAQDAVGQDFRPQSPTPLQRGFRARRKGSVLPRARRALCHAVKAHTLDCELATDQRIEIDASGDHIAPEGRRRPVPHPEPCAEFIVDFCCEERDLALVVGFEIEETITLDTSFREAGDLRHFERSIFARWLTMAAEEIVSGRDIEALDRDGWCGSHASTLTIRGNRERGETRRIPDSPAAPIHLLLRA